MLDWTERVYDENYVFWMSMDVTDAMYPVNNQKARLPPKIFPDITQVTCEVNGIKIFTCEELNGIKIIFELLVPFFETPDLHFKG